MAIEVMDDEEMSPAERRRQKVRASIIQAAEAIFEEDGESGISMRRIAERIDYSPAALYKYFESKEALFEEIREQFFVRLMKRMHAVQPEWGPQICPACLRAYVETGLEQPSHYRLAFSADGCGDEDAFEKGQQGMHAADYLEGKITQSIEEGWFRECDPRYAACSVWASAHGLTMLCVTIPGFPGAKPGCEDVTLDKMIDFQGEMLMRSLGSTKLIAELDNGNVPTCKD